jgi:type IV secretory pathway VirB10-like protein
MTQADPDYGEIYNGHRLVAPLSPFELKAGAIVPAALLTAVDTARAGPVIATVTQNVYDSVSGRHLLLPQGTRLIGKSEGESSYGDRRAFLTWERLILPNGKSLILTSEAGVDAQGAIGVRGQVDRRLFPLLIGTLFAGAITTLGQVARDGGDSGGLLGDAGDAAAIEGAQVGGRLVDRELEVRPSIRLRAGAPVRVMITRDLILEPYRP